MKKNGFTIIEVLASIIVFAIVMAGSIQIYFYATELVTLASHKKYATQVVNAQLEEIKKNGYAVLPGDGTTTPCTTLNPSVSVAIGSLPAASTTCNVNITDFGTPTDYKSVEIILNWTEANGNPESIQYTTFISS